MAINSYGYPGSINSVAWAAHAALLGSVYAVDSPDALAVTGTASGVTVAAGRAHGHGVTDVLSAPVAVALSAPASGTAYWLVVLRRTWQTTNATSVQAVALASAPSAMPSVREDEPGIIDDHPLAIAAWTAGQATPVITDLRLVGAGTSQVAASTIALDVVRRPGHRVRVAGTQWQYSGSSWEVVGGGGPWEALPLAGSWVYYGIGSGMAQAGHRLVGDEVVLRGVVKGGTGLIGTLPEGRRPLGGTETFIVPAGPGAARVQVTWTGTVTVLGYVGGGTNAEVNLGGVRFVVA